MITQFKIFESENNSISFIPNDLIPYYEDNTSIVLSPWIGQDIGIFLEKLLINKIVEFSCVKCLEKNIDGWGEYTTWTGRNHKGKVRGISYGYNWNDKINLNLELNRIKYNHNVDANKSITIYGDISDEFIEIINGTNILSASKKYNI